MKKIIIAAMIFGSALFFGCTPDNIQVVVPDNQRTYQTTGAAFNEPDYVWGNFIFTTNRVNKVK